MVLGMRSPGEWRCLQLHNCVDAKDTPTSGQTHAVSKMTMKWHDGGRRYDNRTATFNTTRNTAASSPTLTTLKGTQGEWQVTHTYKLRCLPTDTWAKVTRRFPHSCVHASVGQGRASYVYTQEVTCSKGVIQQETTNCNERKSLERS